MNRIFNENHQIFTHDIDIDNREKKSIAFKKSLIIDLKILSKFYAINLSNIYMNLKKE